jgi:peptide/nickel transport system permease protein
MTLPRDGAAERAAPSRSRLPSPPVAAGLVLGAWLLLALVGPEVSSAAGLPPSQLRSVLTGARDSAFVVAVVFGLAAPAGWVLGVLVGAGGRGRDSLLARLVELLGIWPSVVVIPLLDAAVALPRPLLLGLALSVSEACRVARLVRGEVLRHRVASHVTAARALGASRVDRFRWHVLPQAATPLLVACAFVSANAIASDASVAFLGWGGAAEATWGGAIAASLAAGEFPWAPLLAVLATTAAAYTLGEWATTRLDPRPRLAPP